MMALGHHAAYVPGMLVLHLLVVAGALLSGWGRLRADPALARWLVVAGVVALLPLALPLELVAAAPPPSNWQPLQEGDTASVWRETVGSHGHAGQGFSHFFGPLLLGQDTGWRAWTALQLLLAPAAFGLLAVLVRATSGSGLAAVVIPMALADAPGTRLALGSDQLVVVPALLLMLAVPSIDALGRREGRVGAALHLLLVAGALSQYHPEGTALPLGALLTGWFPARWSAAVDGWLARAPVRWGLATLVVLQGLVGRALGGLTLPRAVLDLGELGWPIVAAWPLQAGWTLLPPVLLVLLPSPLAVLGLLGLVRGLVTPARTGFVGVAAVLLFHLYVVSAHAGRLGVEGESVAWWEIARYSFQLLPLVALGAAYAWTPVVALLSRPGLVVAPALLLLLPSCPGAVRWLPLPEGPLPDVAAIGRGVNADPQVFSRLWIGWDEAEPGCAWITETWRWGVPEGDDRAAWAVLLPPDGFGRRPVRYAALDEAPVDAARRLAPDAPCGWLAVSPECSRVGATRCLEEAERHGAELAPRAHVPFIHPNHGYRYADDVPLGRVRLWGP